MTTVEKISNFSNFSKFNVKMAKKLLIKITDSYQI